MPTRRMILATMLTTTMPRRIARAAGRRVIVIGAGLAGLGAARVLANAGVEVVVIEARDRIGGRIHTSRLWPDLPVDLGASWIHGTKDNPLTALARKAGAATLGTSYDRAIMRGPDGDDVTPDFTVAERILADAIRAADRLDRDMSVAEALDRSRAYREADAATRRLVAHLVNATLEQEYGGAAEDLSAWHGDDSDEFGGGDVLFPGGFDQVIGHLAQGLDVRTGQVVKAVAPGRVRLAGGSALHADTILCTVPLGVLKAGAISFAEPLAPARRQAVDTLGMGLLDKCWLRFDRIAWPDDVDWIEWLGPEPGVWAEWVSLARAMNVPALLGFNAAREAEAMAARDDRAVAASAHDALKAMFGSRFPAPVAAQVTRWRQDPFARGSYSFNAVGSNGGTRKALAGTDWDGALHFAGEACEARHFGTAHGALLSGRRAAERILRG